MIVRSLCRWFGLDVEIQPTTSQTDTKLLAVGSVLHEARGTDVVWGVGVNSKNRLAFPAGSKIRFLSVRGPLTRSAVLDQGFQCPPIYGDPGLLFPMLFDDEVRKRRAELELAAQRLGLRMPETIVIPNINDDRFLPYFASPDLDNGVMIVRPNLSPFTVAAYISAAKRVVSSSLHGLVFADVYGRPTTRMISQYEPEFKYSDYYLGTGRPPPMAYANVEAALDGVEAAPLDWDPAPLLEAFPFSKADRFRSLIVKRCLLKPGKFYRVTDFEGTVSPLSEGWARPSSGSVWTTQTWSKFEFVCREPIGPKAVLRMEVGTLAKGKGAFELLRVVHGGNMIASFRLERNEPSRSIFIPLPEPGPGGDVQLSFKVENASIPKDYSDSPDERSLGVWVSNFEIMSRGG